MTSEQHVYPPKYLSILGKTVKFTCHSDNNVIWKFNTTELPGNAYSTIEGIAYILTIANVALENTGMYTCFGDRNGQQFESSGILIIKGTFKISTYKDCNLKKNHSYH